MMRILCWMLLLPTLAVAQVTTYGGISGIGPPFTISSPSNGQCLTYQSSTAQWINASCTAGGSINFSALVSGTNTTAAMIVGTGASLATSGSGSIAATTVSGTVNIGITSPTNGIDLSGIFLRFFAGNSLLAYFNGTSGALTVNNAYADGSVAFYPQTTGFTQTISSTVQTVVFNPAGTLATGSITMPASPANGQIVQVGTTQVITALTVSPNSGQTITGAPTTITPTAGFRYIYVAGISTWVRLN